MSKYICTAGEFKCKICGTVYPFSDLRERCEGRGRAAQHMIAAPFDELDAEIGEKVIRTQYHGDDYAQAPYKGGIFLSYEWTFVRSKRVVSPAHFPPMNMPSRQLHYAQYRIGDAWPEMEVDRYGDPWDIPGIGGGAIGFAIGPYHFWSQRVVENAGDVWPNYVIDLCEGEKSDKLLQSKANEGYPIHGFTRENK